MADGAWSLDRRGRRSFMGPKISARWFSEKWARLGLAELGGDGSSYLLLCGVLCPTCDTDAEAPFDSDEALEWRRKGLVSTELPVF